MNKNYFITMEGAQQQQVTEKKDEAVKQQDHKDTSKLDKQSKEKTPEQNNKSKQNKEQKKQKNNEPKVLYYSFEILEHEKILDIVKNNLSYCYYSSIVDKKIIFNNKNLEDNLVKKDSNETNNITDDIDQLQESLEKLNVENSTQNQFEDIEKHLKDKDNGMILIYKDSKVYKINEKFHITMLFPKGGEQETEQKANIEQVIGQERTINITKMAFSEDFITLGVAFEEDLMPYYGNEIKHITVGLRKHNENKKLFPKDSPNAFKCGYKFKFSSPIEIKGLITKVMNK